MGGQEVYANWWCSMAVMVVSLGSGGRFYWSLFDYLMRELLSVCVMYVGFDHVF